MKKFCNKITKQQWRVTVPNINTTLFKRSPKDDKNRKTASACYDLEEAQREYDRCRSVPNGILEDSDSSSSDSQEYQDATMSEKRSSNATDDDTELYVDVEQRITPIPQKEHETAFEYDVPKISFSFFGKEANQVHQDSPPKEQHKSEVVIVLTQPKIEEDANSAVSLPETSTEKIVIESKSVDLCLTKNLDNFPIYGLIKSGSDPNIRLRTKTINEADEDDDEEVYKVPKSTKRCRLSQSLTDFNVEAMEALEVANSNHSSIEHISCSQIITENPKEDPIRSSQNSESMEYCKARSKLPLRIRRATLLRRPKTKAVDTWVNIRTKVSNILSEHAAQQKVGAFENKDKIALNIEEVYKSSKDKCKRVLKSTGKMFSRNKENSDTDGDSSSQIIRNHAFFAKVKASDIEYKLNYTNGDCDNSAKTVDEVSDKNESPISSNREPSFSHSASEEKKEEFDFGTIKSAFRRSRMMSTEVR